MTNWQHIETAPLDGRKIIARNIETGELRVCSPYQIPRPNFRAQKPEPPTPTET